MRADGFSPSCLIADVIIEALGAGSFLINALSTATFGCTNIVIDHEYQRATLGITPAGRDFQVSGLASLELLNCSGYADPAQMGTRTNPLYVSSAGSSISGCSMTFCYFGNSPHSAYVGSTGGVLSLLGGCVLDNLGNASRPALHLDSHTRFSPLAFYGGKVNTIRDCEIGLMFDYGAAVRRTDYATIWFESITDACVVLGTGANVDVAGSGSDGFLDGGSNTGVGIRLAGPGAVLKLPAATDVEGTGGAIEMGDGTIKTYLDLTVPGVLTDAYLNVITQ